MKNISVLGSTGSIGRQTLEVISRYPDKFKVLALSAGENIDTLSEQITKFKPEAVSVKEKKLADALYRNLGNLKVEILYGENGACEVATWEGTEQVVSAMVGASGLMPTLSAIKAGKDVALANKEALVVAGEIVTNAAEKKGVGLIPVDSEHSAIFQALKCGGTDYVKRLIITASGGPFLNTPVENLKNVTVEVALNHPTWKMGNKITIDSATLMNKGFEIIEAKWLFGFKPEQITVWVHPQSIIHSMVEYIDGSILSQMSEPDMKIPIAYALSYPERISINEPKVRPESFGELTFREVDYEKFPSIRMAFRALEEGGTLPAVMNGANEVAVHAFLSREIGFTDIITVVQKVMDLHTPRAADSIDNVLESDAWARETTSSLIRN